MLLGVRRCNLLLPSIEEILAAGSASFGCEMRYWHFFGVIRLTPLSNDTETAIIRQLLFLWPLGMMWCYLFSSAAYEMLGALA